MKTCIAKTAGRLAVIIICLVAAICLALPCFAAQTRTVRVGFFAFDGYHQMDENGARSGYGYELLQHLAGYAGFEYEYIGYDKSWSEMQDMLEKGEIDLLTSAQKTPEREARFYFSNTNIGVSAAILTVKAGDSRFMEADYANWSGIRVGMIQDNSRNDSFREFAEEKGFTYSPVYFDDTDDMVAELKSDKTDKDIDAVLTSNLRRTEGEWLLTQFASSPFYVIVQKGDAELLGKVNSAITQMDVCEPGLRTRLMNKYYTSKSGGNIAFTAEERAYIQRMKGKKLTALINPDRAPYSYYKDGELTGVVYDAAMEIIRRTGLDIEFIKVGDAIAYCSAVDSGMGDIRFEIANSYNAAEENGCWLTAPFLTVPMAKLYHETTTSFATASEPLNRDVADDYIALMHGMGFSVTFYPSIAETVDAVLNGKADASYMAIDTATMAIRNDVTNRLVCDEIYGLDTSYAIAVDRELDPLLYSILNKAASSITDSETDAIRQRYAAGLEKPFSLIGYFYDYPLHVLIAAAILLFFIILMVAAAAQIKRRKIEHAHLQREQKQNELLRDALGVAEKAGAAKSQFLSRVSHEMRTPLNAIIGFIELAKGTDKAQMESYMTSADLAAKQLLSVINDVLDMSSIESGKLKIASAPLNFKHLISSITNIYGTQCRQKGLDFETKITTPTEDWLVGDELRVNQILMNLLGNAVKFTAKGHIWLTISETAAEEDTLFLRFEITDTGCGMSEELKERLFNPFEQESAATAKKYGGSGLGLSIVKSLTSMMGGTIKADSRQGEGTTFTVDLPFKRSDTARQAALPKGASSLRILAVDDEKSERDYISAVLNRMDVRFDCACSGSEALDMLAAAENANDAYNVCLIDWRMPEMNGSDTTCRIRQSYGKDVIVIVVSAYDYEQAGENASAAGADMFLSKPLFQSSLFDLLMTITGGGIAKVKAEPQSWDFAGRRVLLAEDNALNQIVAKGYLAKFNVVTDTAGDGKTAVGMFLASPVGYYDAVLMDIQMPVMDGFEATKAIRESNHPQAKTIQIIAQTADAFNEDITRSLSAGMNAHVSKPIRPELLAKALSSAFEKQA